VASKRLVAQKSAIYALSPGRRMENKKEGEGHPIRILQSVRKRLNSKELGETVV
jgi:hypothetical protein